jgi:hypothetical protein
VRLHIWHLTPHGFDFTLVNSAFHVRLEVSISPSLTQQSGWTPRQEVHRSLRLESKNPLPKTDRERIWNRPAGQDFVHELLQQKSLMKKRLGMHIEYKIMREYVDFHSRDRPSNIATADTAQFVHLSKDTGNRWLPE